MKAYLHNYRQSPRKVRLVASLVKGKGVDEALVELGYLPKRASFPLKKLLLSAVSNAKNLGVEKENLIIKEFRVDKGVTLKRIMPRAMGSASRINKRTSNITLLLVEKGFSKKEEKEKKGTKTPKIMKEVKKLVTSKPEEKKTEKPVEKKVKKTVTKKTK